MKLIMRDPVAPRDRSTRRTRSRTRFRPVVLMLALFTAIFGLVPTPGRALDLTGLTNSPLSGVVPGLNSVLGPSTPAGSTPGQGNAGLLDISGVLQLNPPLKPLPTVHPFVSDDSLLNQLVVRICRMERDGTCVPVTDLSAAAANAADRILRVGPQYAALWTASGAATGQVFRLTFVVGCMNIGSTQMRAVDLLSVQTAGTFVAGLPVPIVFSVDQHPVVRTRALHDLGTGSIDAATPLMRDFKLNDADAFRVLYHDVRHEDIDFNLCPVRGGADSIRTAAAAAGRSGPGVYQLSQVFDGIASPATYGDSVKQAVALAKANTPSSNQTIVNGLASSRQLARAGLTPGALLGVIRDDLGVADKATGIRLLSHAVDDTCDGCGPAYDATTILQAAMAQVNGVTSIVQALQQLADAGYGARTAMDAVLAVGLPGTLPGFTGVTGTQLRNAILALAEGAVQVPEFPDGDITDALNGIYTSDGAVGPGGVYPAASGGPAKAATDAAKGLVARNCTAYDSVPDAGSVVAVLAQRQGSILPTAEVVRSLMGCNGSDLTRAATGLHNAYFANVPDKAAEAAGIGEALVRAAPQTPASGMLLALAKTLKNSAKVPADTVACLSTVGVVKGADAAGKGDQFDLFHTAGSLDQTPDLQSLIPNPYGKGAGGNLDKLGQCLGVNGLFPDIPLRLLTVRFVVGTWPSDDIMPDGEMWTGRVGWQPSIPDALKGVSGVPALDQLKVTQVPNPNMVPNANLPDTGNLLTLPAFAVGPGEGDVSHDTFHLWRTPYSSDTVWGPGKGENGCLIGWGELCQKVSKDFPPLVSMSGSETKSLNGVKPITFEGFGTSNGVFRMIIPALPGKVTVESAQYTSPSLSCIVKTPNPALQAATIALPYYGGYRLLPDAGDPDILAAGQRTVDVPEKPNTPDGVVFDSYILDMEGQDHCGRLVGNGNVGYQIQVERFTGSSALSLVNDTIGLPDDPNDPNNRATKSPASIVTTRGAADKNGNPLGPSGPVGAISSLLPKSPAGNFFSLLSVAGGAPLTGNAIQSLGSTGFMP